MNKCEKKKKYESHNFDEFAVLKACYYNQTAFQGGGGEEGGCERVLSASLFNCT